jgi:TolB-like protein/Flp pilus assembly protein TadD
MSLTQELKRRNVFRVAIAYVLLGWAVLQGADFLLDLAEAPGWVIRVFAIAGLVGFPFALFFAWAYELTPEGIKRESEIDRGQSMTPHTGKKLNGVIIGLLLVAIAFLLLDRLWQRDSAATPETAVAVSAEATQAAPPAAAASPGDRSIAVLPLANRSTNPEDAFFAEGMHDELLTHLSRVGSLHVISRTSVMGYANTTKRMPEIGRELGVATILEGGVQRAGDRVRINVQLIDTRTDQHLWAEVYDRELTADNLFEIQSDITRAIAGALRAVLSGAEEASLERKATDNVEAYAHYLRARATAATYGRSPQQLEESIASYLRAIELDPDFAVAWAALSIDYAEQHWTSPEPTREAERSLAALRKAEALAPDSEDTLIAAGYYHYWVHKDYAPAIAAFDAALVENPASALALRGRAYTLRRMGRIDEAVEMFQRALALDPLHAQMRVDMSFALMHSDRLGEALANVRQANAIGEPSSFGRGQEASILLMLGRLDEAREVMGPPTDATDGFELESLGEVAYLDRDPAYIETVLEGLRTRQAADVDPAQAQLLRARLLHATGRADELVSVLESVDARLAEMEANAITDESTEQLLVARIQQYALQGDEAAMRQTIEQFERTARPDALSPVEVGPVICEALALIGDYDGALDRLEPVVDRYGMGEFTLHRLSPAFDGARDMPRFQALVERHDAWLARQPGVN